jgi:hypothetical protein
MNKVENKKGGKFVDRGINKESGEIHNITDKFLVR